MNTISVESLVAKLGIESRLTGRAANRGSKGLDRFHFPQNEVADAQIVDVPGKTSIYLNSNSMSMDCVARWC